MPAQHYPDHRNRRKISVDDCDIKEIKKRMPTSNVSAVVRVALREYLDRQAALYPHITGKGGEDGACS